MKPATIKDIAQRLDIHHSTVSRALKDHPDVAKETQTLVFQTAKSMNYSPNLAASALRSGKRTGTLVTLPMNAAAFVPGIFETVAATSQSSNLAGLTISIGEPATSGMHENRVVFSFENSSDDPSVVGAAGHSERTVVVHMDLRKQMEMAVQELTQANRRRLGLLVDSLTEERRGGHFNEILLDRFLPVRSQHFLRMDAFKETSSETALEAFFSGVDAPNGVVVCSPPATFEMAAELRAHSSTVTLVNLYPSPDMAQNGYRHLCFDVHGALSQALHWLQNHDSTEPAHWIDVPFE